MIRVATTADAAAIRTIYAPCVEHSAVTFETAVPDVATLRTRILERLRHYPWLVWDDGGDVLAYAYASRFRERAAYDWVTETSVYVREDARRRGLADALYRRLLQCLQAQGFTRALGVITLPGAASVALHQRLGFAAAGVWPQAGYKLGRWHDVGVWQKPLAQATIPPAPPHPFADLVETGLPQMRSAD